ncbi:MAG: fibronectin type III domain-containing protein [Chitinophagaceae bacterium]
MQKFYTVLALACTIFLKTHCFAQSVLNSSDTIVEYNSNNPPVQPAFGQIGKWVRTRRLSWNTNSYKAYIYKGCAFRLKFPKTYDPSANDGKKYPMLIFFHGLGETGSIYDNEYQLYHGGQGFSDAVDNGTFDGYILCMQSQGFWGPGQYQYITELIDYMVANNKLDPFRVSDNGLSAGGQATWEMLIDHPTYLSASLPMSSSSIGYKDSNVVNAIKYTPMWLFQGGLDGSPAPPTSQQVRDAILNAGGDFKYTEYPYLGHGTWDMAWSEPDFYPFILRSYQSNPWPLFGRTEFCPGDSINVTLGLTNGFDGYQWRKDGVVISGATSNTLHVTQTGVYDARIKRGLIWSDWSHTPVQIKIKAPTVTPPITVVGLMSTAIPAADGKNYVNLQVPDNGYVSYSWKKVGKDSIIGNQRILTVNQAGNYIVSVTEQYGCSSIFSPPFAVINANGNNAPDAATNLVALTLSNTQIELDWANNPSPTYNETAFETYRSTTSGGPYTFAGQVPADTLSFIDKGLTPNIKYYYKIRAINNNGAAVLSNEANAITQSDKIPPSAPKNLRVILTNRTSVSIAWDSSSDNVGVDRYDVFVNGIKTYSTTQTSFIVGGLQSTQQYSFYVKARDISGNYSPQSNQVNAATVLVGIHYKYYEGSWNVLPDFNTLIPLKQGTTSNIDISVRDRDDQFGFVWEGFIHVPVSGTYTFETYSDDGSKLWIGPYNASTTPLVNNDGLHGGQYAAGTITLQAGIYPISAAFFEQGGGQIMQLYWTCTQLYGDNNRHQITDQYFKDTYTPGGIAPAAPANITAVPINYNKINIALTDNSNNETGFEIYRSTNSAGPYNIVFTTGANVTSFSDSNLTASTTYYYKVQAVNQFGSSGLGGLKYSYYEGIWNNLPDFNSLTPIKTGSLNNVSLSPANNTTNYAFKYEGIINIPSDGQYTFYTTSDDGSKLYIGGFNSNNVVVNNDYLQAPTERSGNITLTKGIYPIYITFFQQGGGYALSTSYQGPGISKQLIPDSAFNPAGASATTLALPAAPNSPTNFVVRALSTSQIKLTWKDVATTETGYNVYRSVSDTTKFKLLAALSSNSNKFTDSLLFANVTYYYKIAATGVGGTFGYSSIASAKTKNNAPIIADIPNRSARYGITTIISVTATDADGDPLTFIIKNKPVFARLTNSGNKTATLTLNPTSAQQGVYNNMQIIVRDNNGGADTTTFNLTVNDNYDPTIDSISDYTLNENDTLNLHLSAHDQNSTDILSWSITGLPNAFTLTLGANGFATLLLHPNYAAAGVYTGLINVNDGRGGLATRQFKLTVNDKNPNANIYVRFKDQDSIGSPWNSVTSVSTNNLKDGNGNTTNVGLAFQTSWWAAWHEGPQTGNNSGIYPDAVLKDYYYFGIFGGPETVTAKLTGLDTSRSYNLSFYAGSNWSGSSDNGTTTYTVGAQTVPLYVQNNTQNTASINSIKAAADGTITFTMAKGANTPAGYINALVITSLYDDGSLPLSPKALIAQNMAGQGVQLSWQDAAYNETGYEIYRAINANGPFNLAGTANAPGVTTYLDTTTKGNTHYYYKVRAVNTHGASAYSNIADIITTDKIPKIASINNVVIKNNQQLIVNVTAMDDVSDHINLTATNLPSFVTFVDNGNGTGAININPIIGTTGIYQNITVTATDNSDSSSSASFDITVTDKDAASVYLNFSDGTLAGKPWNNLKGWPFAGTTFTNMVDDSNNQTGISVTLVNGFEGVVASGMRPGNAKGVYPEVVMRTGEFESSTTARTIKIAGLSSTKKYNFVFFNSHDDGLNGLTKFTINNQSDSLNATYNIDKTVQINGISPDVNGQVSVSVSKGTGADYAYISAMVIQIYDPSVTLLEPTDLRITDTKRNSVTLQWADRSYSETGFEIWRATDSSGQYILLNTLSANVTSYTDASVSTNSTYYYIVRAKQGVTFSNFSNVATATTLAYAVYINFTSMNEAPLPWNNINAIPQIGYTWNNFLDETSVPSSIGMQVTNNWAGLYSAGMNTGNNSGIFPDNVMIDSYGLFPGQNGTLKITGLNFTMKYNFTFFASSQAYGDVNVAYTINGKTCLLNASLNKSGTVTMYDIVPDNTGEIIITVSPGTSTSQFGLIGALIIQGYIPSSNTAPPPPAMMMMQFAKTADNKERKNSLQPNKIAVTKTDNLVTVFPNPFHQNFTLAVPSENNGNIAVSIYDLNGKLLYSNQFNNLTKGKNYIKVETNQSLSAPGVYIAKVLFTNKKTFAIIKLIKQ